jgi:wobble nucleotide-excising tRNase
MSKTLIEIAQQLSTPRVTKKTVTEEKKKIPAKEVEETKPIPKVQLIYAFNGTGKTRLSREFKQLIAPKNDNGEDGDEAELSRNKILYYNAFTEDLFYWDNDLELDAEPKLKIQPNSFTDWILREQGQDQNIITNFQHYVNEKLTPRFNEKYIVKEKDNKEITVKAFSEVTFSLQRGDDERSGNLKISKGEESNFIWSIFYTLLEQVIGILNVAEHTERETNQFDQLEYVFIDDPVSSLDENHLIELAVNLADLIKSSQSGLKFIVTTHTPLFYNVLFNELNGKTCYLLERFENGTFALTEKHGDSNKSFSYHLYLKQTLEQAIAKNQVQKYHFTLLRNLYEKTASFLGYPKWSELLPDDKQTYLNRIIQFTSHSTLSNEAVAEPSDPEKNTVALLLNHLVTNYGFWQQEEQHG